MERLQRVHGPEHLRGFAWCHSGGGSTKAIWPASPSNGWVSGVARLWATPDGTPLEARDAGAIEAHGPYIRGGGFPAVNGVTKYEPVATSVIFRPAPVGLSQVDLRLGVRRRRLVLSRIPRLDAVAAVPVALWQSAAGRLSRRRLSERVSRR